MAELPEIEARLTAVEARLETVAADASAARHLAAARDRDLADLGVKIDAHRTAISALGEQTAARFDRLEGEVRAGFAEVHAEFGRVYAEFARVHTEFGRVDAGFVEMRGRFDQVAAGFEFLGGRIDELIERDPRADDQHED